MRLAGLVVGLVWVMEERESHKLYVTKNVYAVKPWIWAAPMGLYPIKNHSRAFVPAS